MTKLFEIAIETARLLPDEKQDEIARVMLTLAQQNEPAYALSEDEETEMNAAISEIERGELASEEEFRMTILAFNR